MTEGKRITLSELFARKEREIREYQASPEGQAAWKALEEKIDEEKRMRAVQEEGEDAALSGKPATECPYRAGSTEARLWVYGFENPPMDGDEDDEDDEECTDDN